MKSTSSQPRVLIVDDDPVSLRFLEAAVMQCGCAATTADKGATAAAADGTFDLLLIDRHLPDIGGTQLLHALRERGIYATAIATSAEIDAAMAVQLRTAGFADVLEKPASTRRIHEIISRHLPNTSPVLLDDTAALDAVGGDAHALRALRNLLARELEELERELERMPVAALIERLHRLRASCGFCGATALAACAADWQNALRAGNRSTDEQRDAFAVICRDTKAALHS